MPSLQQRGLLNALRKQKEAGVIAAEVADKLAPAYCFLRRVEHLLQYREDEQTHLLPRDAEGCTGLDLAMGMTRAAFDTELAGHSAFGVRSEKSGVGKAGVRRRRDRGGADI